MFKAAIAAFLTLICARAAEPKQATPPAPFVIEWKTNGTRHSVLVVGDVQSLQRAPEKALLVHVEQRDLRSAIGLPSIIGKYHLSKEALEFRPQFPFQPGVRYRATFYPNDAKPISAVLEIPLAQRQPTTVVTQIYPTADVLPENLLKFYLYFSAPMSGGHIYEHIHLIDGRGVPVELPFLEIDEELWNSEMRRLTLFLDPGRIKRGVKPLEEVGPALVEGKQYTLTIDSAWLDATGTPLKSSFEKKFRVGPSDREPPRLEKWELALPKPGTREPLKVTFPDPMDHALALRMIGIDRVKGHSEISDHEHAWSFTPDEPWSPGVHTLQVQTTIEDLAGNNIGKPFEVDLFSGVEKRIVHDIVERPFEVK